MIEEIHKRILGLSRKNSLFGKSPEEIAQIIGVTTDETHTALIYLQVEGYIETRNNRTETMDGPVIAHIYEVIGLTEKGAAIPMESLLDETGI